MMRELIVFAQGFSTLMSRIEQLLGAEFDAAEVERALQESLADSEGNVNASEKKYRFCSQPPVTVNGLVEEHEPESIWIEFAGVRIPQTELREVFEAYCFAFGPGASYRSQEESLAIFRRSLPT